MTKLVTDTGLQKALELVADKLNNPLPVSIEYPNNTAQVDVDFTGTKYDMIESPESTIELNGRTLVNMSTVKTLTATITDTTKSSEGMAVESIQPFKQGVDYTLICNITSNTATTAMFSLYTKSGYNVATFWSQANSVKEGLFVRKITTRSDSEVPTRIGVYITSQIAGETITFDDIVILEGDYTNVPVRYFEGLKSAGETKDIEVKSTGNNILNLDSFKNKDNWELVAGSSYERIKGILIPKGNYTISFDFDNTNWIARSTIKFMYLSNLDKGAVVFNSQVENGKNIKEITLTEDAYFGGYCPNYYVKPSGDTTQLDANLSCITNLQLERNNTATEYEPYKESIATLPNIEPLRSLPNGVADEVFIHDDKVVITRNLGEIVLNGTETITAYYDGTYCFNIYHSPNIPIYYDNAKILVTNDKLNSVSADEMYPKRNDTGNNFLTARKNGLLISVNDFTSIDEVKTWLVNNNVTVIYQLATPTYEWYELPSPHLYKDGHIFVETGAIPLTSNSHDINVSLRSAINTNVEEIIEIKEELNTLDMATGKELLGIWRGIYEGVNE